MKAFAMLLVLAAAAAAQTMTGSLTGSVLDPAGLPVQGAAVAVRHTTLGFERTAETDARGLFTISALQPGEYEVAVRFSGFKTAERKAVNLPAADTLALGEITLEVGDVAEKVTVTAEGATVQTASAERSGLITSGQVENLAIRGRNVFSLLQLMPGVVITSEPDALERNANFYAQGGRVNTNTVSYDGMILNAMANPNNQAVTVSQDAVAEVKVLLGNYQAEYGRMSGANIQVVTKSGTRDFHGLGAYFKRHEQFNANNFFSNLQGVGKARYRFNTFNYNVGGPVFIPNRFNRDRDKLFFFWSQEIWPLRSSTPVNQRTVPTEPERAGDFSQSVDLNNALIVVRDPTTGSPFPGNRVPADRVNASGQALLKVFPLPNFTNRAITGGRYNWIFQVEQPTPIRTQTAKLDYNVNPRNMVFGNYTWSTEEIENEYSGNWPQLPRLNRRTGWVAVGRYQRLFSPTLINELNLGFSSRPELDLYNDEDIARNQRDKIGFRVPQFSPASNPLGMIPNATFAGVTNAATLTVEPRLPHRADNYTLSITNNLTKNYGAHTFKTGIYYDHLRRSFIGAVNFNGTFDFGRNASNPLDTGYAYGNAIAGVFNSYTEATSRPQIDARSGNVEWFVQDNWKATRRLSLDLGVRFYWMPPIYDANDRVSGFVPGRFDPARQVQLIRPGRSGNQRVGIHPVTGAVYPAVLIGAIAPGTGDPRNGLVSTAEDTSVPRSLAANPGVQLGPRVGFAYDLFGRGKTAIRGGFGMFHNRQGFAAMLLPYSTQAPLVETPVVNFGRMADLGGSAGFVFPQNINGLDGTKQSPYVMNFSLSVQQDVGAGTVVDVGYVGSLGRNLVWNRNLNSIPFGANFLPSNADPTNPSTPLAQAFLRPHQGFNNIVYRELASSSNYHSMQVTVNRRFARSIQYGVAWTWSKSMDYASAENETVSTLLPVRVWDYGLSAYDRTHVLKVNWLYDLPRISAGHAALRQAINGWQISGIASFISGEPLSVGFTTTTPVDITGSPTDSARVVVAGDPVLPRSERTFSRNFRTEAIQLPARGTVGNAASTIIRGPGINNWDLVVLKNFPIHEQRRLQFRWELYNAFNHTQFSAIDTQARFDPQGRQVNSRLGEFTAARTPRVMQLALRFYF